MKVSVIGGAGHVGLGLCLVLADAGHQVNGIDIDREKNSRISAGQMPFIEEQGEEYLARALSAGLLRMTDDLSVIADSDVIVVVIGTEIDRDFNPVMGPLRRLAADMSPFLKADQLIILRSTVSPGMTDLFTKIVQNNCPPANGEGVHIVFAPERVIQGRAIIEMKTLPQLVGASEDRGFSLAEAFFQTFVEAKILRLTPTEAEIGKLITNTARYVSFALANEFHLIGETYGVNMNRIIDACNDDYPRLDMPGPGPNVGGPCLYKDGWFLIDRVPYNELLSSAFRINEGMPSQIAQKLEQRGRIGKVAILGMTFKANSDDTRNSVSFKMKKQMDARGAEVVTVDPNVPGLAPMSDIRGADSVILMTPHREFADLEAIMKTVDNPDCLFVDIWGFWSAMRYQSDNGYFFGSDVGSKRFPPSSAIS